MSVMPQRVPPHNLDAEQSVLGAMLIDRDAILRASSLVVPEDFYAERHQSIYAAMLGLYNQGESVDLVTTADELRQRGHLETVGGASYLSSLAAMVPTTANIEAYALIVEEKSVLRRLQQAAYRIIDTSFSGDELEGVLFDAESAIFDVTQRRAKRGYEHVRQALYTAYDHIEFLFNKRGGTTGVPTGFRELDNQTAGLQASDLIILAARPSLGKTAFALNLARNAAVLSGKSVAFFSLEMSKEQIALRLLSMEAAVDLQRLRTGTLLDEDWLRLSTALSRLAEANIFIDDTPNVPLGEMRSRARRIQAEHGLDMIVVDYLQLMTLQNRNRQDNRTQEISEISRSLKSLARELKVPLIALSQLSRAVEQRQDKRPMLSDLRESGSIEQDADVVAFLYREDYYDRESERRNLCEIILAKQRNGPVGSIELYFMKEIGKFMTLEQRRPS